jgi:hypothetical protein
MYFYADQKGNEPDIITSVKNESLTIKECFTDNVIICLEAPKGGWTNELLGMTYRELDLTSLGIDALDPLDAYLGDVSVGSTEC